MIKAIVVLMLTVVFSFGAGNSAPYTNEWVRSRCDVRLSRPAVDGLDCHWQCSVDRQYGAVGILLRAEGTKR